MTRFTVRKQILQAMAGLILIAAYGMGCQPVAGTSLDDPTYLTGAETDVLMTGSWEIERANVTFFDEVTGDLLAGPVDVFADHAVPVHFNAQDGTSPVMMVFGGSFHFGEGADRWSNIYLTIIEDGEYYRNADEEYEANPPQWDDPDAGGEDQGAWGVDDNLRLVIVRDDLRVEAMVDMDQDGEHAWLDYDREAPLFSDSSCINNVHLRRIASN